MKQVQIGDATLIHGDCLEALPTLQEVAAVVTDPPYELRMNCGTATLYGTRVMQFDFDVPGVTSDVVLPALDLAFSKASSFHCFCDPEQFAGIAKVARANGMTPKPFAKLKVCPPPPMPGNWWPSAFELACYGYKPNAFFGDTSSRRRNAMKFDSYRHGIRAGEKVNHPTQKWLPMIEYIVRTLVPPGGCALDPFMGSGTTGVAAVTMGRKFIGIEKNAEYFDIACQRIDAAQRQAVLFDPA